MPDYMLKIELEDVAEGDVIDLADSIWDDHAESFDAKRGEFVISISREGFPVAYPPQED